MFGPLVDRARDGDEEAFDLLARQVGDRCMAMAVRILRDVDAAEDAVQTGLIEAWRRLGDLRDPERFEAWVQRIVINACYRETRRRRWSIGVRQITVDPINARDDALTVNDRDQLDRAFRRLTPEQRAILVLHHYLGLSVPEIAERLGVPLGTVKSRLHYAGGALRASIEADARTPVSTQERSA
jgi:RNA polymerase sigma-70 factor (ECF subfamily)